MYRQYQRRGAISTKRNHKNYRRYFFGPIPAVASRKLEYMKRRITLIFKGVDYHDDYISIL